MKVPGIHPDDLPGAPGDRATAECRVPRAERHGHGRRTAP